MSHSKDRDEVLQHYMDDLLFTSDEASPGLYADPLEEQRERLQKLLYSGIAPAQPNPPNPLETPERVELEPDVSVSEVRLEPETVERAPETALLTQEVEAEFPRDTEQQLAQIEQIEDEIKELAPQTQDLETQEVEWLDNGLPAWAQQRFDVLLFTVSGLTLAVPLISLGQIQTLNDNLTPLFGQADWFMGLLPTPRGKIRTVNTAKFVMPERYDENFVRTAQYVISINGVPWGLAVDSVNQPISLNPEDVKWRTERSRRPWLAGTVKEHMCALLDIPRMGQLLMEADRRRGA